MKCIGKLQQQYSKCLLTLAAAEQLQKRKAGRLQCCSPWELLVQHLGQLGLQVYTLATPLCHPVNDNHCNNNRQASV